MYENSHIFCALQMNTISYPDLKKKTYTQKLKIPRSLKLLSVKGHWNSFHTIYGQINYWNSNFLFSNFRLVILSNIVYTFYNAKLFAVLPCLHLKQNGLTQVIVTQTSAVFLHMENSYYSGEAIYQEGKKMDRKTQIYYLYDNLPVIHNFELFTFPVCIIYLRNMIINLYFRVSLNASYMQ